jgi:hypothetical protein
MNIEIGEAESMCVDALMLVSRAIRILENLS